MDSWRTTDRGIVPDSYLAGLSYDKRENSWKSAIENEISVVFVVEAESPKQIVGFVKGGEERSKNPEYTGEARRNLPARRLPWAGNWTKTCSYISKEIDRPWSSLDACVGACQESLS